MFCKKIQFQSFYLILVFRFCYLNQGSFYWNFSTLSHLCWSTNCTSRWVLVDRFCWFFHQTALAISEPVLFLNLPFKLIFFLSDLWFVLCSGCWEEPEQQVWRSLQVNCDAAIRHPKTECVLMRNPFGRAVYYVNQMSESCIWERFYGVCGHHLTE